MCSLGPRLSLNGQSQLKLGYWRPRAEQPGHQESKIKQRPLLPPKIDHHRQLETRLRLRKTSQGFSVNWHPPRLLLTSRTRSSRHTEQQMKTPARNVIFNLAVRTKEGGLEVIVWPRRAKSMALLLPGTTRLHSASWHLRGCGGESARRRVGLFTPSHLQLTLRQ